MPGMPPPFGKLQALPEKGKAVTTWKNRDEAFADIARGIREVAKSLAAGALNPPSPAARPSTSVPKPTDAKVTSALDGTGTFERARGSKRSGGLSKIFVRPGFGPSLLRAVSPQP